MNNSINPLPLLTFPSDSIFNKDENKHFSIIQEMLLAANIEIKDLVLNQKDVKKWELSWNNELALLTWISVGGGCPRWFVESIEHKKKLSGVWKNFDLYSELEDYGVNLEDGWYDDAVR